MAGRIRPAGHFFKGLVMAETLIANNDTATTQLTAPVVVSVLANDLIDGVPPTTADVSVALLQPPDDGSAVVNLNGSITYAANQHFSGLDTFTYRITDLSVQPAPWITSVSNGLLPSPDGVDWTGPAAPGPGSPILWQVAWYDEETDEALMTDRDTNVAWTGNKGLSWTISNPPNPITGNKGYVKRLGGYWWLPCGFVEYAQRSLTGYDGWETPQEDGPGRGETICELTPDDPDDPPILMMACFQQTHASISLDGGDPGTWAFTASPVYSSGGLMGRVGLASNGSRVIAAGGAAGAPESIRRSDDRGATWQTVPNPFTGISQVVFVERLGEYFVLATADGQVAYSATGASFQLAAGGGGAFIGMDYDGSRFVGSWAGDFGVMYMAYSEGAPDNFIDADTAPGLTAGGFVMSLGRVSNLTATATVSVTVDQPISYNCGCDDGDPAEQHETLAQLRRRMMIRLGFSASADNPPPGKLLEIDDYLQSAQRFLYKKVASFRQKRFFRWPLEEGVRFYDMDGNDDVCEKTVLFETVEYVGVSRGGDDEGNGEQWSRLICGISPDLYSGGIQNSWPTHYEVRQCIEVWPAPGPDAGYLRVKGKFGLLRFTEPTDRTTIDSELVFNFALARARADAGKLGAKDYDALVQSMIGDINAGSHHTRRYVPGSYIEPTPPMPVMKDGYLP